MRDASQTSLLLIAGGIGVTPFIPIIRHLEAHSFPIRVSLLLSNKNSTNVPFLPHLKAIAAQHPTRFDLLLCVTQEKEVTLPTIAGRISAETISGFFADFTAAGVYVCGPEPFIQASLALLASLKVPSNAVSLERFDF